RPPRALRHHAPATVVGRRLAARSSRRRPLLVEVVARSGDEAEAHADAIADLVAAVRGEGHADRGRLRRTERTDHGAELATLGRELLAGRGPFLACGEPVGVLQRIGDAFESEASDDRAQRGVVERVKLIPHQYGFPAIWSIAFAAQPPARASVGIV